MEAVCRGASEGGGESAGVVLAGRGSPNRWVSRALSVGDLSDRLRRLRDESEAAIFLPHGLGTMLEIVWMAESVAKGDVAPRPLVFLGEYCRATAAACLEEARGPGATLLDSAISFAATPAEAVGRALGRAWREVPPAARRPSPAIERCAGGPGGASRRGSPSPLPFR